MICKYISMHFSQTNVVHKAPLGDRWERYPATRQRSYCSFPSLSPLMTSANDFGKVVILTKRSLMDGEQKQEIDYVTTRVASAA